MTIPPERRTNALGTSVPIGSTTARRVWTVVEGLLLAAVSLVVYLYAVFPLSVAFTPLTAGSWLNLIVLLATILVLNTVYNGITRLVR